MKIPFSLEEYKSNPDAKIVTRDGRPVEILYTDRLSERCVIALVNGVDALYYFANGRGNGEQGEDCADDLFFDVEPELSAFEKRVADIIRSRDGESAYGDEKLTSEEVAHIVSKDLLELAKREYLDDIHDSVQRSLNNMWEEGREYERRELLKDAYKYKLHGRNTIENLDMDSLAKRGIHWGDDVNVIILKDE